MDLTWDEGVLRWDWMDHHLAAFSVGNTSRLE